MARKAVLEGGKRDEIIAAAEQLFFSEGFENTSVRMILEKVGGEVGMFYHYFRSKEELFDIVTDRFFRKYETEFEKLAAQVSDIREFADLFLPVYETAMERYGRIEGNMHWTIRYAMHERTLQALMPSVRNILEKSGYRGKYPPDIASAKILADVSAAVHSESFAKMDEEEKKRLLNSLLEETMNP